MAQRAGKADTSVVTMPEDSAKPALAASGSTEPKQKQKQEEATASEYAQMVVERNMEKLRKMGGLDGMRDTLATDFSTGVTQTSISSRITRYGKNELPPEKLLTFMDFVKEALEDKTMLILIGAAVISLIMGMTTPDPRTGEVDRSTGWIEGFAILLSVAIVTILGSVQNYQKQEQFASIVGSETLQPIVVVRDGTISEVQPSEIVVGDVVMVFAGMSLGFDALLLEGNGFACDEISVTGEPDIIHKSPEYDPFLISGTNIVDGCDGMCVVVAVGVTSFAGAMAISVRGDKSDTPLQERLNQMADLIGKFGLGAAVFTFGALLLKELYLWLFAGGTLYAMKFFENLTTAVAIVVVAVPEGLPLSVTLSLAYSMKQMFQDGNLVRHLTACETMGAATTILSDKTGTLTRTDIKPAQIVLEQNIIDVSQGAASTGGGGQPVSIDSSLASNVSLKRFLDCIMLNYSNSFGNNKTAEALVALAARLQGTAGYDATEAAAYYASEKNAIQRFAFSSVKKQGSVVIREQNSGAIVHYVAGAAELVLKRCTHALDRGGNRVPLTGELKKSWESKIRDSTVLGLRTLSFAYSERTTNWSELPRVAPEDPLTLIGVTGIEEPVREEVPASLARCMSAGIRVIMVTGDNSATALNVAQRVGLVRKEDILSQQVNDGRDVSSLDGNQISKAALDKKIMLEGETFREMDRELFVRDILPDLKILARATPEDKLRLVAAVRTLDGETVAVTGDGTNDAPALKMADVGFAMNSGTDIAKQASDIVLLQDHFTGVVKAVMWGRNVRGNIRKFLQFQLTVNLVACIVAFSGAVLNSQNMSPLKPVQLLWLNLIMDTLAALALATELPSEAHLMSRPAEPRTAPIITLPMKYNVVSQCAYQLLSQIVLMLFSHNFFSSSVNEDALNTTSGSAKKVVLSATHTPGGLPYFGDVHLTIVFNAFVMMQVFNFFNARLIYAETSLFQNWRQSQTLLYIVGIIFLTQVAIVQRGGMFMSTVPLDGSQWAFCILIGAVSLPIGTATRAYYRKKEGQGSQGGDGAPPSIRSSLL